MIKVIFAIAIIATSSQAVAQQAPPSVPNPAIALGECIKGAPPVDDFKVYNAYIKRCSAQYRKEMERYEPGPGALPRR